MQERKGLRTIVGFLMENEYMKLRNILIVVKNIEKSKRFYHDLFGLDVILDNDELLFDGRSCASG